MTNEEWESRFLVALRALGPPNEQAVTDCLESAREDRHKPSFADYTPEKMAGFQAFQSEVVGGLLAYVRSTPDYNTSAHASMSRAADDRAASRATGSER